MALLDLVWLLPLIPLLSAIVLLLGRRVLAPVAGWIASVSVGSVFLLACGMTAQLAQRPPRARAHEWVLAPWWEGFARPGVSHALNVEWGLLFDPLSALMALIITGIGLLIHLYSISYMKGSPGYGRYFGFLNLFVSLMLLLVLANNYLLLFAGWEGVGVCSWALIGYDWHRRPANNASLKAFLTNRVGDMGLLLGMLLLWGTIGTLDFMRMPAALSSAIPGAIVPTLTVVTALLAFGAAGKSAQFPLLTWLPDAMEGPTPVSALIHAATMVTAGIYLVARSSYLFQLTPTVSMGIGIIGAFTAIFAAAVAVVQHDLKKVLAWSTVSQLGFMGMALGAGAYWVAMFHVFTHAFFKALLFLGAGSVIHGMEGCQDMRRMGGLRHKMPWTFGTMFVGAAALAGIPGLAGFFSKDEILWRLFASPLGFRSVYVVGLVTAGLTAFYMWRMITMVFYGQARSEAAQHVHEAPWLMRLPLVVLAVGSVLAGWINVPREWHIFGDRFRLFEWWLGTVFPSQDFHHSGHAGGAATMWLSIVAAVGGIVLARYLYLHRPTPPQGPDWLYKLLLAELYLDRFYRRVLVDRVVRGGGTVLGRFDRAVVDGAVNAFARGGRLLGRVLGWWDRTIVDGLVRGTAGSVRLSSYPARLLQPGQLQVYALVLVVAAIVLLGRSLSE